MGTIGSWSEDRLWNWVRLRLAQLPDNTRGLIARAVDGIAFPNVPPPGQMGHTARSTAPDGWLAADGSAVSRTTYADLFAAIGTTYGVGDGSTTFNLPDARGRHFVGLGTEVNVAAMGRTEFTLGGGLLLAQRTPYHAHLHIHSHGMEHNHAFTTGNDSGSRAVADAPHQHSYDNNGTPGTTGNQNNNATVAQHTHTHSGTTGNTSNGGHTGDLSGTADEDTDIAAPAYITFLAIIKF